MAPQGEGVDIEARSVKKLLSIAISSIVLEVHEWYSLSGHHSRGGARNGVWFG